MVKKISCCIGKNFILYYILAQQFIDQSFTIKMKASAVLTVGGGQVDQNGIELREKIVTPTGEGNNVPTPGEDAPT